MIMKGYSTGCPPIQVRMSRLAIRIQNSVCEIGRNISPRCFEVCSIGIRARMRIDITRASTPPSLFGIERRIA